MSYQKSLFDPVFGNNPTGANHTSHRSFSFAGSLNSSQINGNNNERADLMTYLDKDFREPTPGKAEDNPYRAEILKNELKNLQTVLPAFGFPIIGDLFSGNLTDIEATLRAVNALVQQRQKDLEFRQEIYSNIQKVEADKTSITQQYEKSIAQRRNLEGEIERLQGKLTLQEKGQKEEREKYNQDKEEMTKTIVKLQSRDTQYIHEIRNIENQKKRLQDQIKKLSEKGITFKNSFECTAPLENKGPVLFAGNSDSEFTKIVSNAYEETRNKLLAENEVLKDSLVAIQKELSEILEQKKELFFKRRRIELGEENREDFEFTQTNLLNLKKDLFEMPIQTVGKETIECLQENLRRFREYMTKLDVAHKDIDFEFNFDNAAETEKIKCVKSLKALLKNYKYVIETQDALINKSIMKQGLLKNPEEFNMVGSRFKVLDEKELERAKLFILEQKKYLEEKNTEVDIAKRTMGATTKKLDEEKMLISQKRQEIEEETEKFRSALNEIVSKNQALINDMVPEEQENISPNKYRTAMID